MFLGLDEKLGKQFHTLNAEKEGPIKYFALQVIKQDMLIPYELKKCCKKYKKGKRCKKCPAN